MFQFQLFQLVFWQFHYTLILYITIYILVSYKDYKRGVCPSNFNWNNWNWNRLAVITLLFYEALQSLSFFMRASLLRCVFTSTHNSVFFFQPCSSGRSLILIVFFIFLSCFLASLGRSEVVSCRHLNQVLFPHSTFNSVVNDLFISHRQH